MEHNDFFNIFDINNIPMDSLVNYSEKFKESPSSENETVFDISYDVLPQTNINIPKNKVVKFEKPSFKRKKNLKPDEEIKRLAFTYSERQRKNKINNSFDELGEIIKVKKNIGNKLTRNEILNEACDLIDCLERMVLEKRNFV